MKYEAAIATDLFGNEHVLVESAKPAIKLDLFDAAAERLAIDSGRPVSQEHASLLHPEDTHA